MNNFGRLCFRRLGNFFAERRYKSIYSNELPTTVKKIIVCVFGPIDVTPIDAHNIKAHQNLKVFYGSDEELKFRCDGQVVHIEGKTINTDCRLIVPFQIDLDITSRVGPVHVRKLFCDNLSVICQSGSVYLDNVKGENVFAKCEKGDITCEGTVRANINFETNLEGAIKADTLFGNQLFILGGQFSASAVYADKSVVKVENSLNIGSLHGTGSIETIKGPLSIGALDGDFCVKNAEGKTDVTVTRTLDSVIASESGDVRVRIPEDAENRPTVSVECSNRENVVFDENLIADVKSSDNNKSFEVTSKGSGVLRVRSSLDGRVDVGVESWFSSLKLNT